jgi:hypothetical protein
MEEIIREKISRQLNTARFRRTELRSFYSELGGATAAASSCLALIPKCTAQVYQVPVSKGLELAPECLIVGRQLVDVHRYPETIEHLVGHQSKLATLISLATLKFGTVEARGVAGLALREAWKVWR